MMTLGSFLRWGGALALPGLLSGPMFVGSPAGRTGLPAAPGTPWVALPNDGYAWPVNGPVIRGFEPPQGPYGPGHRGIDIAAPFGTDMVAAQDGTVAFAGWVGGSLFISIDHPDGVRSTYSWLSAVSVTKGDEVARGQLIGQTGHGHPDEATPHLHFGTRIGSTYVDPMLFLEPGSVVGLIHLAPLDGSGRAWSYEGPGPGPPSARGPLPVRPP